MNAENPLDPLDNKIDELVASQPLRPSAGFTDRVLMAVDEEAVGKSALRTKNLWLRLALPIAALLVATATVTRLITLRSTETEPQTLSMIELQEIFILEEGLTGLTSLQDGDLNNADLLGTLIFLNSET